MIFKEIIKGLKDIANITIISEECTIDIHDVTLLDGEKQDYQEDTLYIGYFAQIDEDGVLPPHCLLATNTYSEDNLSFKNLAIFPLEKLFSVFNKVKGMIFNDLRLSSICAEFLGEMSKSENLGQLVNLAAMQLGNSIIILDVSFKVLAKSTVYPVEDPLWSDIIKRGYATYSFTSAVQQLESVTNAPNTDEAKVITCWATPLRKLWSKIMHNGKQIGSVLMIENESKISTIHFSLLPIISRLSKEMIVRDPALAPVEESLYQSLLYEMIIGAKPQDIMNQFRSAGLTFFDKMCALVLRPTRYLGKTHLRDQVHSRLKSVLPGTQTVLHEDCLAALVPLEKNAELTSYQLEELEKLAVGEFVQIGISRTFLHPVQFSKYYLQARKALQLANLSRGNSAVCLYEKVSFYDMLEDLGQDKQLGVYCHPALRQLNRYDHKHKTDFYHTLKVYLDCACSLKETAKVLYIHRNSLSYRLERIEKIAGLNLDDVEIRFVLMASYRIDHFSGLDSGGVSLFEGSMGTLAAE